MGFNPPVPQRDSNTEIRVAVVLSLLFQIVLIFAGPLRKRSTSLWVRFLLWSCYLLADWVADLALGLLLNNMGNIGGGGSSSIGGMLLATTTIHSTAALKHVPHGGAAISRSFGAGEGGSPIIFAFWAPFLLLHLGGPDTITAYSLADNELWLRHLIGLLFELSAAGVVFLCSLQGNPMIVTTILMFVAGIIKYGERTYSLHFGSTEGFPVSILDKPEVRSTNIPRLMTAYSSRVRSGLNAAIITIGGRDALRDVYDGEGWALSILRYTGADEVRAYDMFIKFRSLFVNGVISTRNQRVSEGLYTELARTNPMKAFRILELELNYTFDLLYTKMPVLSTTAGYVLRFVSCSCVISSLVIFAAHDKAGLLPVDVGITYALLVTAVVLEAAAAGMLLFSNWTTIFILQSRFPKRLSWLVTSIHKAKRCWLRRSMWSGTVWQMNFIDNTINTRMPGCHGFFLAPLANVKHMIWQEPLGYVKEGQQEYELLLRFILQRINDTVVTSPKSEQRKKACEVRGEGALRELKGCFDEERIIQRWRRRGGSTSSHHQPAGGEHGGGGVEIRRRKTREEVGEKEDDDEEEEINEPCSDSPTGSATTASFDPDKRHIYETTVIFQSVSKRDFDESLLLWHIATDLCLNADDTPTSPTLLTCQMRAVSKCLSQYMLYLLLKKPEMVSATMGIGQLRYNNTYADAMLLFESWRKVVTDFNFQKAARGTLLGMVTGMFEDYFVQGDRTKTVLFNACILAKALMESFTDEEAKWKVIAHVWAEMLTFTAAHTQAREHLGELSRGGELITVVWFLMAHMGMSSFLYEVQETESLNKLVAHDY